MKILSTLILLILTTSHAMAAATESSSDLQEYDVEIIIFEDAHARYLNSETWPQNDINDETPASETDSANVAAKNLDSLSLNQINASSFKNIKPAILGSEYKRINSSSEYNVLFYGAWRQAGLSENEAFEIKLEDLKNSNKNKSENTITGHLKLILARYLHIYGDLVYQRPVDLSSTESDTSSEPPAANNDAAQHGIIQRETAYPITFHRRMRSKELHYIDHPLVGILIQINPVDKPVTKSSEESKD